MLPDIPLSSVRSSNYLDRGDTREPCLICGDKLDKNRSNMLILDEACEFIIDPARWEETHGGFFPVGRTCLKNHPELLPYVVKVP